MYIPRVLAGCFASIAFVEVASLTPSVYTHYNPSDKHKYLILHFVISI